MQASAGGIEESIVAQTALGDALMARIARFKMTFWPYDFESQLRWLKERTEPADRHVMLLAGEEIIGYLRLTPRRVVGATAMRIIGVSTVAIGERVQSRGYGKRLMQMANRAIAAEVDAFGALCCGKDKVAFYERSGWSVTRSRFVKAAAPDIPFFADEAAMTYRAPASLEERLLVEGDPF